MRRKVHALVLEIVEQLQRENQRLTADYNRQVAFNNNQQAMIEAKQIEEYDIADVDRPKIIEIPNPNVITDQIMQIFESLSKAHEDDPGLDGVEVREYKTQAEIAEENKEKKPKGQRDEDKDAAPVTGRAAEQASPHHRPVAGERAGTVEESDGSNVTINEASRTAGAIPPAGDRSRKK